MDFNSDSSMLSDELRPRRTPVPSSFGDLVPRPSVPDLSIIEAPQRSIQRQLAAPAAPARPQASLNHLSYNDWRQKTIGGAFNGNPGDNNSRRSCETIQTGKKLPSPYLLDTVADKSHPQENFGYTRERVEERTYGRSDQCQDEVISYKDPTHRPRSAPSARPQQAESGVGREQSLSKSAPPTKSPNHYQYETQGPGRPFHHASSIDPQNCPQQRQPNEVPSPESNNRYSSHPRGPTELRLVPSSSFNPQQMNIRRQAENSSSPSQKSGQINHNATHVSKHQMDQRKNHVQFACNEVPSPYHEIPRLGAENIFVYPSSCYHAPRNNVGSWSCGEHAHCPPAASLMPQSLHPMPPQHPQVSYDDLYKLVLAQNEQLKALQAQVERILLSQDRKDTQETCEAKKTEKFPVAVCNSGSRAVSDEGTQTAECEQREDDCQKMSIGVMTSFIHAVTYRGRVERLDAVHNVSEHESLSTTGNLSKQSKSASSDDYSSSSLSPALKSSASQKNSGCTKSCKDCSLQERPKKCTTKKDKLKLNPRESRKRTVDSNAACSEGCNCNNPGVSAAITAVRGCQAVLASRAGATMHDYSTFNGADLPTVTEQPVSPMSSIHVDLHDYRSSSSDEQTGSSGSEESAFSGEDESSLTKDEEMSSKPNGWTFYNNVLGQVNKILEERDMGGQDPDANRVTAVQTHKQTDVSVSKRVAFETQGLNETPQNLKEMALKYLRENHPEELVSDAATKKMKKPHGEKLQEMAVYNMPASNMSFATFRYLERYNLLPDNFNPQQYLEASANMHGCNTYPQEPLHSPMLNRGSRKLSRVPSGKSKAKCSFPTVPSNGGQYQLHPLGNGKTKAGINVPHVHHASPSKQPQLNTPTSKILDITTLRQQPKLL